MRSQLKEASLTTLYLIRHAHAEFNPDEGRPLSPRGRADAALLADLLSRRPFAAVYSSPARRALETVEPLAVRVGLRAVVLPDLRERELAVQVGRGFVAAVEAAWREPHKRPPGGESNLAAQSRGLRAIRSIIDRHPEQPVAVATHGNLLALILNALDPACGYEFWRRLTFPDVYQVELSEREPERVVRVWKGAADNKTGETGHDQSDR